MRYTIILSLFCATCLFSCRFSEKTDSTESVTEQSQKAIDAAQKAILTAKNTSNSAEDLWDEFKELYRELHEIKGTPDFKKYGFAKGGPYNDWLRRVVALMKHPNTSQLYKHGVVAGDLKALGQEYVLSRGQETDVTKSFNSIMDQAISPVAPATSKITVRELNEAKRDELIGRWRITNKPSKIDYVYEIYKDTNSSYYGLLNTNPPKKESLHKSGNKYSIIGNKSGEYYIVDRNNYMTLYDRKGELLSMAYKAKYLGN